MSGILCRHLGAMTNIFADGLRAVSGLMVSRFCAVSRFVRCGLRPVCRLVICRLCPIRGLVSGSFRTICGLMVGRLRPGGYCVSGIFRRILGVAAGGFHVRLGASCARAMPDERKTAKADARIGADDLRICIETPWLGIKPYKIDSPVERSVVTVSQIYRSAAVPDTRNGLGYWKW